jgi:transcriptional regulator with XRE-family HTH domain
MGLTKLGIKVKKKLIERGLTQNDLSNRLMITRQHLSSVLHGSSALRLEEWLEDWCKDKDTKSKFEKRGDVK